MNDIRVQMNTLIRMINEHNYSYYTLSKPTITDSEYDSLVRKLKELENKYPHLIQDNTPTNSVGSEPSTSYKQVQHLTPMLSLMNVMNKNELTDFLHKVNNQLNHEEQNPEYVVELKLDGVALSLFYKYGKLIRLVTRGNGTIGEDITQNIKLIKNIPLFIPACKDIELLEIRGEALITKSDFESLNQQRVNTGLKKYSNPRNTASGIVRQLNNDNGIGSLSFYAYSVNFGLPTHIRTQHETLGFLKEIGFETSPFNVVVDVDQIHKLYTDTSEKRDTLDYDIDGLVIKLNNLSLHDRLSNTSRAPKWAVAYKFPPMGGVTIIESVDWSVSKSGKLTPIARLTPIDVCGTTISNVTLHNYNEILRLGIKCGCYVNIERAGDVIPKINRVVECPDDCVVVSAPKTCPVCHSPVTQPKGEVNLYCTGGFTCTPQRNARIHHFANRDALNIHGLSTCTIDKLATLGILENIADIYKLSDYRELILSKKVMGKRSLDKLLLNIEESKQTELFRFIYGLGIRGVGVNASKSLACFYGSLEALMETSLGLVAMVEGIGYGTALNVYKFINDDYNKYIINELIRLGVNPAFKK